MSEIESTNRLTDHLYFCSDCYLRAVMLAKQCQNLARTAEAFSLDFETKELIRDVLSKDQYKTFNEIIEICQKASMIILKIKQCENMEDKYDNKIMKRNFFLSLLKKRK